MNFSDGISILSLIFLAIVLIGFFNEKVVRLPEEIGLLTITLVISLVVLVMESMGVTSIIKIADNITEVDFHDVVLGGFICYLLFSGSAKIKFKDLTHDRYLIASLAFISTLISTLLYAGMAMVIVRFFNIPMNFIEACILGSIIAPTDPISAMSILNKAGLSKRISIIVEGESLFNDGIAVALFVTFMSINQSNNSEIAGEFLKTIGWNVFGALGVGLAVSYLLFKIFERTTQKHLEIIISLTAVSSAYSISELLDVSAPTAAVVVGIYFATKMNSLHEDNELYYANFYTFWHVVDKILNAVLYIMIGVAVLYIHATQNFFLISMSAIIMALIARYISVLGPINLFSRNRSMAPKSYTKDIRRKDRSAMAKLLTWAGLKGGICIALALGTSKVFSPVQYNFVITSTYAVVVFSTLIQGLTVKKLYSSIIDKLC